MEQPTNTTDTKGHKEIVPEVTWAQRSSSTDPEKNYVFLTIVVPDVPADKLKLDIQPTYVDFSGYSNTRKATYKVKLDLFAEIDPKESKTNHTTRSFELVLRKKELNEEFWPRLLKVKGKVHFLKTDFDKWVDEDEQDEAPDDEDYMSKMGGGMGGAGGMPPGAGGMGGEGFGGIDFSKLGGGAGGMPDFSQMGDMSSMLGNLGAGGPGGEEGEEDDDDDEMPELEGEDKEADASAPKSKIEEVE